MKNSAMPKIVQDWLNRNPNKVEEAFTEEDGFGEHHQGDWSVWVYLTPGWSTQDGEVHFVHEATAKQALSALRAVVPCNCQECQALLAKKSQEAAPVQGLTARGLDAIGQHEQAAARRLEAFDSLGRPMTADRIRFEIATGGHDDARNAELLAMLEQTPERKIERLYTSISETAAELRRIEAIADKALNQDDRDQYLSGINRLQKDIDAMQQQINVLNLEISHD